MKKSAFSLLLLVATIALAHAGGFGGPPPFTNGSPLISGVDGSYQASARGKNLAGVFRFAYSGGIQITSPSITLGNLLLDPYNDYVFFVEGVSYRGLVQANINISKIFGVLDNGGATVPNGPQEFIIVTNPDGDQTVITVDNGSLGSLMSGFFEGSMDHNSPYAYFSGKGQVIVSNGNTSNTSSNVNSSGNSSTDTSSTSGPNSSSGSSSSSGSTNSTSGPNTTSGTTTTSGSSSSTTGPSTTTGTTTTSSTTSTTGPNPTTTTTTTSSSSTSGPNTTSSADTITTSTNSTSGPNVTTSTGNTATSGANNNTSVTSSSSTTSTSNDSATTGSQTQTMDRVFSVCRDFKFSGVRAALTAPTGGGTANGG